MPFRPIALAAVAIAALFVRSAAADERTSLDLEGATIAVEWDDALKPIVPESRAWVESAARTVARFYGRFPAERLSLRLDARPGGGVGGGRTTNYDGAKITVSVGTATTRAQFAEDWVLVHEMIHLALPEVGRGHNWLAEGLATYIEGIARAQAGTRPVADVWSEFRRSMPVGLPKPGEGGLDQTRTWARTYWGGAVFCLQADVSIREQSGNRFSLRDALIAILKTTGGYAGPSAPRGVDIDEVFRVGDEAAQTHVLTDLYARMKESPDAPDLTALFERLGVRGGKGAVEFDERAPLAAIRAAMTGGAQLPVRR
jgi:hypothetical protein